MIHHFPDFNDTTTITAIKDEAGEPWFVAKEVAKILGYRDAEHATRGLDEDEKGTTIVGTPGGPQTVTIINESGLYSTILRSRVEEARAFKKWVTSEVLPTIRKTGGYVHASLEMSDAEIMARAMKVANYTLERVQKERDKALKANLELARRNVKLFHQTEAMTGPTEFFHELMDTTGSYTFTDVAAMFCAKSLFLGQ
ncbi:Bro-N domain-containing protein [Oceanidesulfovibrio marinus]|uniref:Bro-N domain-containing protein n=1 Tax=Oceanidesulfovibrio marinus TaxID=370038 RepID=A0A6P1ZLB0_9BACT|nr:Bro-N domain-containing protein [Oceanidesulfovibrio marinus]TVM36586.1 hypothetical protein DQK91_01275 [Oceanidesulfovibrio marinus]